jgi:hypothetical protein
MHHHFAANSDEGCDPHRCRQSNPYSFHVVFLTFP